MRTVDLIEKKRNNNKLTKVEIEFLIGGYVDGTIPDYQMSALMMAIYFNGMDDEERANLTNTMMHSGDVINLNAINGVKVDKHSTGGVGDKTTLVLAPLVASLGIPVAKMSGRGLGHTGGTLDKLESIEGFNINLTTEEFIKQVNDLKIAVIGQTSNITPADKLLYSLRDVTATVDSVPLIASSIMSKKLASGADAICLDVKVGSGAFMKTIEEAEDLAGAMVKIGNNLGRKTTAILSNMDEPLGFAVGNALEVIEAINTLDGNGPSDLLELCLEIGAELVMSAGIAATETEAKSKLMTQIENKEALNKLIEFVGAQGGNIDYIKNPSQFESANEVVELVSKVDGYIENIVAVEIGHHAMMLGAGRRTKEDAIDPAVGIVLNKKVGDEITRGEVLAYVHTNQKLDDAYLESLYNTFTFSSEKVAPLQLIYKKIT